MSETPESPAVLSGEPEGAVRALFGERAGLARRFCGHLATTAVTRGLLGPREVPRLWDRHVLNCAAVSERLAESTTVIDVGSGAGLPGLALAIARPDLVVVLVEPLQRRVAWLEDVVADLELRTVEVVRSRAQDLGRDVMSDVVTARAVAPLPTLASLCLPLVRPGGRFIAVKGRSADQELKAAEPELARLGASSWDVRRCGVGILDEPTTVVEIGGRRPRRVRRRRPAVR